MIGIYGMWAFGSLHLTAFLLFIAEICPDDSLDDGIGLGHEIVGGWGVGPPDP